MTSKKNDIKQVCRETGHSMADVSRETNIAYPRVIGWVNGYWSITPQEEKQIKDKLTEWKGE